MSSLEARLSVLSNGLTVVSHRIQNPPHDASPPTDICARFDAIAGMDPLQYPFGARHFAEHALSCGSLRFSKPARRIIESYKGFDGSIHSVQMSAALDYVQLQAKVPWGWTMATAEVFGDVVTDPRFRDADMRTEGRVIQVERAANKLNPHSMEMWQATYVGHGKHPSLFPVAGNRSGVDATNSRLLRQFHAENITASNCIVAVEGDFEHDEVVAFVDRTFCLPAHCGFEVEYRARIVPTYTGGDARYENPLGEAVHAAIGFKAPSVARYKDLYPYERQERLEEAAAFEFLANLLRAPSGVAHSVFDRMRNEYAAIYSSNVGLQRTLESGILTISFDTLPEFADDALRGIQNTLSDIINDLDDEAFERMHQIEKRTSAQYKKDRMFAWRLAEDVALHGRVLPAEFYSALRLKVTKQRVRDAAVKMLESPPTFVATGDTDHPKMPSPEAIRERFVPRHERAYQELVAG